MNPTYHYLIQSNVPRPVSYYESNFGPLSTKLRLSGYPHTALEKIITLLWQKAQQKDTPVEIIHNCLDNSIEGLILPEYSAGVFGFDVCDQEERNVLADIGCGETERYLEHTEAARKTLLKARLLHDEQEAVYSRHMDFGAANRLAEETIRTLLEGKSQDQPGREIHRFFGAATVSGNLSYIPELTQDISRRYFIKGRPGTGKSTFLKKVAAAAKQRGFCVEVYHCSLDPHSLDMVVVRDLNFCIFDSTPPHEYFPVRPGDEIIDVYAACVTPGTDEAYEEELNKLQAGYKCLVAEAVVSLQEAKKALNSFDELLPPIPDDVLEQTARDLLGRLF